MPVFSTFLRWLSLIFRRGRLGRRLGQRWSDDVGRIPGEGANFRGNVANRDYPASVGPTSVVRRRNAARGRLHSTPIDDRTKPASQQ